MDKKLIGLSLAGLALSAGVGALANEVLGQPDIEIKEIEVTKEVPVEVIKNVTVEVEKVVEVAVDNENLELVLEEIYDNGGSVDYLVDDLDDDELDLIVDRIVFANDIKALAVAEAEKEIKDLLDKEVVSSNNVTLDEDDIERVRVQDEDDEISLDDVDYEDLDADVYVDVHFEQDDVKYVAQVKVEIKDAEVEDIDLESIDLR